MATSEEVASIFPAMVQNFRPDKAEGVNAVIQFDLSGDNGGLYWVSIEMVNAAPVKVRPNRPV